MTTSETLELMIAGAAAGDRAAFQRLYGATAGRLLAVSYAILRRRELAEEALQEAFINIWRNADRFDASRGGAMPWLTAIVRYRALSMRQRIVREGNPVSDEVLEIIPDDGASPLDAAMAASSRSALAECLGRLDESQRRAIVFAFVRGHSHAELADLMDTPLGTIKSWIRRGLMRLKDCLEHEAAG